QLAYNLNFGAEHCKSDYIVRMDAYDISLHDILNIIKNFIIDNNYPDVGVFSANLINDNNELIGIVNSPADIDQFRKKLCFGNPIVHPASCIRKKALLNNRGYIGGLNCEDFDLWLRMDRSNCNFSFSNQVVLNYRISEHQCAGSRIGYSDVTGFLLRESLYRRSFKFFIGFTYMFLVFIYLNIKKSMK
ncbi:MAG: hypothetical protein NWQ54_09090, partial [Paraglaciecola sp.]|nr:hypothetical protein [Paraglaciecola sp.]